MRRKEELLKNVARSLVTAVPFRPFGGPLLRFLHYALSVSHREVVNLGPMTMAVDEAYIIYAAVRSTAKVPGRFGRGWRLPRRVRKGYLRGKGQRPLHVFDTFSGLPDPD